MKISYNWLKSYIHPIPEPNALAQILTDCGLEVEAIESFESHKGGLKGLVVGEVLECEKHPNADRLHVTKVNIGTPEVLQIVCGAPNVAKGQKVIVATVGTMLYPTSGDSFEIRQSKIRGELSQGMICAEDEIGMGTSHDGIMVLPPETKLGTPAADYFSIYQDVTFEIGLTPNRVDAASHYGTARDIYAALFRQAEITLSMPAIPELAMGNTSVFDIEVQNNEACPRYSGLCIEGVVVKESPDWLKNALKSIGLKPINNIVDVTNYVLHELGHPLHAFDSNSIAGQKVVVRTCEAGTSFVTLDGVERKLSSEDLMICDAEKPLCIAGVFGGLSSGVSEKTTAVFIESAYFNPVWVRKTSKRHGLKTDASFRFERGADPDITITALKRAAALILDVAGGKIVSAVLDHYPSKIAAQEIEFNFQKAFQLIGQKIEKPIIHEIFKRLGIRILTESEEVVTVSVPHFKPDVLRQADLVEELIRIYGYNHIGIPEQMRQVHVVSPKPDKHRVINHLSDRLVANGFTECINNSLTSSAYLNADAQFDQSSLVKILNPLSGELDVMRSQMIFGLMENISYNINRQSTDLKLFEFGRTYHKTEKGYSENEWLAIASTGKIYKENWQKLSNAADHHFIAGILEQLIQSVLGTQLRLAKQTTAFSGLSEAIEIISGNKSIAFYGKAICKHFDIQESVFFGIIDFGALLKQLSKSVIEYREVPKFPKVRRDLALLIDQQVQFREIEDIAWQTERKILKKVNLFDIYQGDKLEKGKKSYAVSFEFQDETQTLSDQQVEKTMKRIIDALGEKLGASLR
ncbi:MAG: phenylalanine--tRNA ligase subunit beta [Flavobacteriales bacterium]